MALWPTCLAPQGSPALADSATNTMTPITGLDNQGEQSRAEPGSPNNERR